MSNQTERGQAGFIPASEHPSANDPQAELVGGPAGLFSIFKVRGGFVLITRGMAWDGLLETQSEADRIGRRAQALDDLQTLGQRWDEQ